MILLLLSCFGSFEECDVSVKNSQNNEKNREVIYRELTKWAGGNIYNQTSEEKKTQSSKSFDFNGETLYADRFLHPNDVLPSINIKSQSDFEVLYSPFDYFKEYAVVKINNIKGINLNKKYWKAVTVSENKNDTEKWFSRLKNVYKINESEYTLVETSCSEFQNKQIYFTNESELYEVNMSTGMMIGIISHTDNDFTWGEGCGGAICASSFILKMVLDVKTGLLHIGSSDGSMPIINY